MSAPKRVCIVGSGRWGSVIAKIVGRNVIEHSIFVQHVPVWVKEELFNGKKLTEIINTRHENIRYLPGCIIPYNVVALSDLDVAVFDADILIFVVPYQYIHDVCDKLRGKVKSSAMAVSLVKGLDVTGSSDTTGLVSNVIRRTLDIECAVLMGANYAPEVSIECFCEATIGCKDEKMALVLKKLFETPYFRITVVPDTETVELCGALKGVVLLAALVCDGLGLIANTKAAVVRLGLAEMISLSRLFYPNTQTATFLQSCGVADLITSCYSGKIQVMADTFIKAGSYKAIARMERFVLEGRKLNGPPAAREVNTILKRRGLEHEPYGCPCRCTISCTAYNASSSNFTSRRIYLSKSGLRHFTTSCCTVHASSDTNDRRAQRHHHKPSLMNKLPTTTTTVRVSAPFCMISF